MALWAMRCVGPSAMFLANYAWKGLCVKACNTAPPLSNLPAYAGVSGDGLMEPTSGLLSAYGTDQALPLIDTIRYIDIGDISTIFSIYRFTSTFDTCQPSDGISYPVGRRTGPM